MVDGEVSPSTARSFGGGKTLYSTVFSLSCRVESEVGFSDESMNE
jgi:hypothetical protein